jgi:hypothetical protein
MSTKQSTPTSWRGSAAYGLYKTPQTVVKPYVNGDRDITAYSRSWSARRQQEATRKHSQAWLEDLKPGYTPRTAAVRSGTWQ